MKKAKRFLTCLLCFALVFVMGGGGIFSAFSLTASAATVTYYSTVIDDLKKDHTFDRSAYPDNATDYSLDVIQIAEGASAEKQIFQTRRKVTCRFKAYGYGDSRWLCLPEQTHDVHPMHLSDPK